MALQVNWTDAKSSTGVGSTSAYAKIELRVANIESRQFGKANFLVVKIFATQAARVAGAQPIAVMNYTVPAATVKDTETSYAYLKTQPEFAAAVDC